ncbi:MAG: FliM/FliN family flagellar motor switch protein [Phycisphaerae bacterium]|nr:FliM/FliN family flagellar motor switch protein [Phycisphaerae bacterium]
MDTKTSIETRDEVLKDAMANLDQILKVKIPIIVKVAQKRMSINNVLKFSIGSIIQFNKDAYQQIDLMVNNHTIGLGQPIKIGENFGLRITQIGDITETIKSLGDKKGPNK